MAAYKSKFEESDDLFGPEENDFWYSSVWLMLATNGTNNFTFLNIEFIVSFTAMEIGSLYRGK